MVFRTSLAESESLLWCLAHCSKGRGVKTNVITDLSGRLATSGDTFGRAGTWRNGKQDNFGTKIGHILVKERRTILNQDQETTMALGLYHKSKQWRRHNQILESRR